MIAATASFAAATRSAAAFRTLSFHLKELSHAGLVAARPEGRYVFYSADFARMKRTPQVKIIRRALGLSQDDFAARYHIPIGTLRD